MKVFIVELGWDYEGYSIDSVYATRESAEKRKAEAESQDIADGVYVREFEVQ